MDDLARGERIKALRETRRLTQPAVVELLDARAGARVVTLRGYQAWEAGGGIRWDNAKLLAEVLGVEAEHLMAGFPDEEIDKSQLDQIQAELSAVRALLQALATRFEVDAPPAPPGELGRRLRAVDPTREDQQPPESPEAEDSR